MCRSETGASSIGVVPGVSRTAQPAPHSWILWGTWDPKFGKTELPTGRRAFFFFYLAPFEFPPFSSASLHATRMSDRRRRSFPPSSVSSSHRQRLVAELIFGDSSLRPLARTTRPRPTSTSTSTSTPTSTTCLPFHRRAPFGLTPQRRCDLAARGLDSQEPGLPYPPSPNFFIFFFLPQLDTGASSSIG